MFRSHFQDILSFQFIWLLKWFQFMWLLKGFQFIWYFNNFGFLKWTSIYLTFEGISIYLKGGCGGGSEVMVGPSIEATFFQTLAFLFCTLWLCSKKTNLSNLIFSSQDNLLCANHLVEGGGCCSPFLANYRTTFAKVIAHHYFGQEAKGGLVWQSVSAERPWSWSWSTRKITFGSKFQLTWTKVSSYVTSNSALQSLIKSVD